MGLPLNNVKQTGQKVEFGVKIAHGSFLGTLNAEGTAADAAEESFESHASAVCIPINSENRGRKSMRHKLVVAMLLFCGAGFSQSADLERGTFEVRGFGGFAADTSNIFGAPKFSGGVEAAIGVNRYVAVTGHYALDRIGRSQWCFFGGPCTPLEDEKMHEFMGGLRLSIPTHSRVTPYVAGTIGAARLVNFNTVPSGPSTQFALGVGLGLNIKISRRTSIALDLPAISAVSTEIWVIRPTVGFCFRF